MTVSVYSPLLKVINKGFNNISDTQYFYIEAYINNILFNRYIIDGGIVIELIPLYIIVKLGLKPKPIKEEEYIKVVNNKYILIKEYIILKVIV